MKQACYFSVTSRCTRPDTHPNNRENDPARHHLFRNQMTIAIDQGAQQYGRGYNCNKPNSYTSDKASRLCRTHVQTVSVHEPPVNRSVTESGLLVPVMVQGLQAHRQTFGMSEFRFRCVSATGVKTQTEWETGGGGHNSFERTITVSVNTNPSKRKSRPPTPSTNTSLSHESSMITFVGI